MLEPAIDLTPGRAGGRYTSPVSELSAPSTAAAGTGRVVVERSGVASVVTRAFATSPLRLLTPANHGRAAWIYSSSYGGGLVDGDAIGIDLRVGAGAAAFFSTQASTKVYRSPRGTRSDLHGQVENGGLLVVAPDPVVCFTDARYRQVLRFNVASRGSLAVIDCLLSGRRASGERWAFAEYRSLVAVTVGGRLAVHDATSLSAADGDLAARFGRFDVLAVAVLVGDAFRTEAAQLVARAGRQPVTRRPQQLLAVSPLGDDGCIVRVAGTSAEQVGRTLREHLRCIPARLGDDPWRRKW